MITFWIIVVKIFVAYILGILVFLFGIIPLEAYLDDDELKSDPEVVKVSFLSWVAVFFGVVIILFSTTTYIKLSNLINDIYSFLGFRKRK